LQGKGDERGGTATLARHVLEREVARVAEADEFLQADARGEAPRGAELHRPRAARQQPRALRPLQERLAVLLGVEEADQREVAVAPDLEARGAGAGQR